ncbi:hypothetical protein ATPR_1830 [Acetobacter tropicalis NBRC 101654]|uniref:Uncharacterized protein n=1 Tax=Acetobacter tropicalis NBRC 101654 TaxID=749388 RepID=F7VEN2_9PROT|nr:hypothetical protein ATPR_1830 [Acetobacter tropicalis NBRC 101654]
MPKESASSAWGLTVRFLFSKPRILSCGPAVGPASGLRTSRFHVSQSLPALSHPFLKTVCQT